MAVSDHVDLQGFMDGVKKRNPGENEFHQAVYEVAQYIFDYIKDKEIYHEHQILRRIAEPDAVSVCGKLVGWCHRQPLGAL